MSAVRCLPSDGRFIGRCGLLPQTIEGKPEYEVAYMIAREYWNRGLGTEAARAVREYGFHVHGFPRLVSIIHPENAASIRVAEKNGMRYIKDIELNGYVDRLYAVEREPWQAVERSGAMHQQSAISSSLRIATLMR